MVLIKNVSNTTVINNTDFLYGDAKALQVVESHSAYQIQRMYLSRADLLGTQNAAVSIRFAARFFSITGHFRVEFRGRNVATSIDQVKHKFELNGWNHVATMGSFSQPLETFNPYTWKRYRVDFEPQISGGVWSGDKVTAYQSDVSSATPNWAQIHQQTVTSATPSDTDYQYHQLSWHSYTGGASINYHIDNLEVYKK
jgi:hypothetical protein